MATKPKGTAGRGDRAPEPGAQLQQGEATELAARVRWANEPKPPSPRKVARTVRLVPTGPFPINVSGRLKTAVWYMPYGADLAYFDGEGRCVGFHAQPQRMTIELVLEYPSADLALEAIRAGEQPHPADLAAALDTLAPEMRDWIMTMLGSQKPKGGRGRPKGSGRHLLDLTHDVWRAEVIFARETGRCRTVTEAIAAVADRHHVSAGVIRNNIGALTNK
jgi:hypothetical protein